MVVAEVLPQQFDNLRQQAINVQNGGDSLAQMAGHRQLKCPPLLTLVETCVLEGDQRVIRQNIEAVLVCRGESSFGDTVRHSQHAFDLVAQREWNVKERADEVSGLDLQLQAILWAGHA